MPFCLFMTLPWLTTALSQCSRAWPRGLGFSAFTLTSVTTRSQQDSWLTPVLPRPSRNRYECLPRVLSRSQLEQYLFLFIGIDPCFSRVETRAFRGRIQVNSQLLFKTASDYTTLVESGLIFTDMGIVENGWYWKKPPPAGRPKTSGR